MKLAITLTKKEFDEKVFSYFDAVCLLRVDLIDINTYIFNAIDYNGRINQDVYPFLEVDKFMSKKTKLLQQYIKDTKGIDSETNIVIPIELYNFLNEFLSSKYNKFFIKHVKKIIKTVNKRSVYNGQKLITYSRMCEDFNVDGKWNLL